MIPFARIVKYGNIFVPENIKKITSSTNTIALLYENGNLYMRGTNSLRSWGTDDPNDLLNWKLVNTNVSDVWCGGNHTIILKTDGLYYCAGYPRSLGLAGSNRYWEAYTLMNNMVSASGTSVKKIECGVQGSQVLMSNGDLFCIGFNNASCLAPSSFGTTLTTFVKSLTNVRDVSYNMNATMVITNTNTVQVVGTSDNYKLATPASGTVLSVWTTKTLPSGYTYPVSVYEGYRTTYIYAASDSSETSVALVGAGYNGYNQIGQPGTSSSPLMTYTTGANVKVRSFGTGYWTVGYSTLITVQDNTDLYSAGNLGYAMGSSTVKTSGFTPITFTDGIPSAGVTEFCIAGGDAGGGITMMRSGNNLYAVGAAAWLGTGTYTYVSVSKPE